MHTLIQSSCPAPPMTQHLRATYAQPPILSTSPPHMLRWCVSELDPRRRTRTTRHQPQSPVFADLKLGRVTALEEQLCSGALHTPKSSDAVSIWALSQAQSEAPSRARQSSPPAGARGLASMRSRVCGPLPASACPELSRRESQRWIPACEASHFERHPLYNGAAVCRSPVSRAWIRHIARGEGARHPERRDTTLVPPSTILCLPRICSWWQTLQLGPPCVVDNAYSYTRESHRTDLLQVRVRLG